MQGKTKTVSAGGLRLSLFIKRIFLFLFSVSAVFLSVALHAENAEEKLIILCTSNLSGHVFPMGKNSPPLSSLAAEMRRSVLEAEQNGNPVLLIDCGNTFHGSFESSLDDGNTMLAFLNSLRYDIFLPGQKEMEQGVSALLQKLKKFNGTALSVNLRDKTGCYPLRRWTLIQKKNWKIAVVGCTSVFLDQWLTPTMLEGHHADSLIPAIEDVIAEIMASKPDVIIFATQSGIFVPDTLAKSIPEYKAKESLLQVAKRFPQVNLIIGGYSFGKNTDREIRPNVYYVEAPAYGQGFTHVTVQRDQNGKQIISRTAKPDFRFQKSGDDALDSAIRLLDQTKKEKSAEIIAYFSKKYLSDVLLCKSIQSVVKEEDTAVFTTRSKRKYVPECFTMESLYRLFPYENTVCSVDLTKQEFRILQKEQGKLSESYVLFWDGKPISEMTFRPNAGKRMRCLILSYTATGGGGHYPELRKLCDKKECNFREYPGTVREHILRYLQSRNSGQEQISTEPR